MKITAAKVIVTCPGGNFVTLKNETAQGVYVIGDATLNGRELTDVSYLADHVVPCLIGMDPRRIEGIWQYLYRGFYWRRGPVTMWAIVLATITLPTLEDETDLSGEASAVAVVARWRSVETVA